MSRRPPPNHSGPDPTGPLVEILADMLRSALAWEDRHYSSSTERDTSPPGVDSPIPSDKLSLSEPPRSNSARRRKGPWLRAS